MVDIPLFEKATVEKKDINDNPIHNFDLYTKELLTAHEGKEIQDIFFKNWNHPKFKPFIDKFEETVKNVRLSKSFKAHLSILFLRTF